MARSLTPLLATEPTRSLDRRRVAQSEWCMAPQGCVGDDRRIAATAFRSVVSVVALFAGAAAALIVLHDGNFNAQFAVTKETSAKQNHTGTLTAQPPSTNAPDLPEETTMQTSTDENKLVLTEKVDTAAIDATLSQVRNDMK
eukprot:SAG31_NODE_19046_length_613_cov_1.221790_1_plen_141_part_10